jgi:pimeloyl-ACP methyl ester carboxylesterase
MLSEIFFSEGNRQKPLVIFIHGMGMNAAMWADPASARILGGKYPLSVLLGDVDMRTSYHDLKDLGFPVLVWSQQRPAGPVILAVEELRGLVAAYSEKSTAGIILVGHSRGGLIARRFLEDCEVSVRGVITVAAPHRGSMMAKWVAYLSPLSAALSKVMEIGDNEVQSAMRRIIGFLNGSGIKEMLPGSEFLTGLSGQLDPNLRVVSIGGTDPELVKIGKISLSTLLSGIMPEKAFPDEMREGKGDGFVSAASAVYPGGEGHRDFHAHHAGLIFDQGVREYILKVVSPMTG